MKLSIVAIFSAVVAAVSAYTPPVGDPKGNPIHRPGLNEQVQAGKPFDITWTPTTDGTVSILLLRGPTENVVYHATIVEGIVNSGKFSWTPSTSLEADVARYGIQIIVDGTGQYQYSTQFGIANDAVAPGPTTTDVPTTTKTSTTTSTTKSETKTETDEPTTTTTSKPTTLSTSTTTPANTTTTSSTPVKTTTPKTTTTEEEVEEETAAPNSTTTTGSKPTSPVQDNDSAAGKVVGSFGLVALVAGVVAFGL